MALCLSTGITTTAAGFGSGPSWTDSEVAGALNQGGRAVVNSVNCASGTFCVAGGTFRDANGNTQAFVSVWNGRRWTDYEVAATLNVGGDAQVEAISCSSAQFCVAGGYYSPDSGDLAAFVSVWKGAGWTDVEVGGALNTWGFAEVTSVSCVLSTFCAVGGYYAGDVFSNIEAFVATRKGSGWRSSEVAGDLNYPDAGGGAFAGVNSMTCSSSTFCVAGGYYTSYDLYQLAFVAVWHGRSWHSYQIAGTLNHGAAASVSSVSCTSAKFCVIAGTFSPNQRVSYTYGFVSTWNGLRWRNQVVHAYLRRSSALAAVSCSPAKVCVAGGDYVDKRRQREAFVTILNDRSWHFVLLASSLNAGGAAAIQGVSCTTRSACVAAGYYTGRRHRSALVAIWNGASWRSSEVATGLGVSAEANAVSCHMIAVCVAGGSFVDEAGHVQAFVSRGR